MPILKELKKHKLLLDTHIWLWAMLGDPKLGKPFQGAFERALEANSVLVSSMSIWEVGMLVEKKRIQIDMDTLDWVEQALDIPGMQLSPVTPKIAIQSTKLLDEVHGDPIDRLLIATAFEENAVLVTRDQKILKYGKGKFISAYNPCCTPR